MELKIESELYSENNFKCTAADDSNSIILIDFKFNFQSYKQNKPVVIDEDGDLVVSRPKPYQLEIELRKSTSLSLAGLQLWRGALVLADFILHYGPSIFSSKTVLELGTGVGVSSIVAGFFAEHVIATDAPIGGILDVIARNFKRNSTHVKAELSIAPFDFFTEEWSKELTDYIKKTDIILASDVIYSDPLTEAFVAALTKILSTKRKKTVFIALEKRYVFTVADLNTVAPCYEYFMEHIKNEWNKPPMSKWEMKLIPVDFPQYFVYERNQHLVFWQIKNH